MAPQPRTLEERFWEKVTKTDTCWFWTGSKLPRGYGYLKRRDKTIYSHRLSYEIHNGPIPDGHVIDHLCHETSCVRPEHLRAVTQKQNVENRGGLNKNNTSGFRGVTWDKRSNSWHVTVKHNRQFIHCGYFTTPEEADKVARLKRLELFTHNVEDQEEVAC